MIPNSNAEFIFTSQLTENLDITDRGLRKMIAERRFPKPDMNLNGRNVWLQTTYNAWLADVKAGKYQRKSNFALSRTPAYAL